MNNEELEEKKKWFFKENIRLEELRKNLEQQQGKLEKEEQVVEIQKQMLEKQKRSLDLLRKQLDNQKHLFDQQWQILERETRQLAIDREVYREARRKFAMVQNISHSGVNLFFKGVDSSAALKKRYKALLKIYHPDNADGDKEVLQAISAEYETLSRNIE